MTIILTYQICKTEAKYKSSKIRFPHESEEIINRLINEYLNTSHIYLTMSGIMDEKYSEFPGLKAFLRKQSDEKRDQATKLMDYQNMRNGKIIIVDIKKIYQEDFDNPLVLMENIYGIEGYIKDNLQSMYHGAWKQKDFELSYLLISHMENQTKFLSEIGRIMQHLEKQSMDVFTCPFVEKMMC
ncbi:unnamed protein product [Acanthosepion pharaonis]|uniref:Ferritin n=1 Tax=Acanthosepion pharaonis TaxID=158019 RepID=A0A812DIB0_ACAPH|nr:unnamed protein product [Sepia pharaonis]